MTRMKKPRKNRNSRRNDGRRRKAQVFLIGAIIATVYVITIAITLHQLQTYPEDSPREEFWTLSHVYVNIRQEIRVAMTKLLATYTQTGASPNDQLGQLFELLELYCEQQGISTQIRLIHPITVQNGTIWTNGLLRAYANISATIRMTFRTDYTRLEDERLLKIAYMAIIRSAPPRFRVELWVTIEQNVQIPVERATVHLIDMKSQERIPVNTFHNGTYYSYTDSRPNKAEILFETGILFVIFFP